MCSDYTDKSVTLELFIVPLAEHDSNSTPLMSQGRVAWDYHHVFAMARPEKARPDLANHTRKSVDYADHLNPPLAHPSTP
jgi:hypothetical protein